MRSEERQGADGRRQEADGRRQEADGRSRSRVELLNLGGSQVRKVGPCPRLNLKGPSPQTEAGTGSNFPT